MRRAGGAQRIADPPWHESCSVLAQEIPMAEDSGSNSTSIVAIFAIMLIVLIGALVAWRMGVFGGGGGKKQLDINVKSGQITQPAH
jgi:hypothetical protein